MRPGVDHILLLSAQRLLGEVAPHVGASYAQGDVGAIAFLLMFAGQDIDRAGENLATDIGEMQAIFMAAAPLVASHDRAFAAALAGAAAETQGSLRLSALTERKCAHEVLLIQLHACIETQEGPEARAIERAVLGHLRDSTARRALAMPQASG